MKNKNELLIDAIKDLDLTPTMELNARDKYSAISEYLKNNGVDSTFQPQGSFLQGTVVRPFSDGVDKDYDLDILTISNREKNETTPSIVKNEVGDTIKESDLYHDKIKEKEDKNCWTLQYAKISNDVGFRMDLTPCVYENTINIEKTQNIDMYLDELLCITEKDGHLYEWRQSNPLGFGRWFLSISDNTINPQSVQEQINQLPTEIRSLYKDDNEIPNYYIKTGLQRAVQIAKRHRDVFYDKGDKKRKPSSFIISAMIAASIKDTGLKDIVDILEMFIYKYETRTMYIMKNDKILNPVDYTENLVEGFSKLDIQNMSIWISKLKDLITLKEERSFKIVINNELNDRIFREELDKFQEVPARKPWGIK